MSLILEALKKAERQHKLGDVPSISAQPVDSSSSGMRGLGWLLLILLACVMLGLGLYLGGLGHTQAPEAESSLEPPQASAPPVVSAPPVQPPVVPVPSVEAPPPQPEVATLPPPAPPPPPPARPLNEMPSGFVANLPSLNIDIHSYDQRAAKRYVLINLNKYREGDYLAEGPQLIEILSDGAVLEHLGERFILPIGNQ
jgi:general secretion pathway protein B